MKLVEPQHIIRRLRFDQNSSQSSTAVDLAGLQTDVAALQIDVAALQVSVSNIETNLDTVERRLVALENSAPVLSWGPAYPDFVHSIKRRESAAWVSNIDPI